MENGYISLYENTTLFTKSLICDSIVVYFYVKILVFKINYYISFSL